MDYKEVITLSEQIMIYTNSIRIVIYFTGQTKIWKYEHG